MIYLSLFWEFLKIGLFSFGGAYAAIPLIEESVLKNGWMTKEAFANLLAISESTPGPIMINSATYIGNVRGGIIGSAIATIGVVLPAFVLIVLITAIMGKILDNRYVQSVLSGIKPCISGIIFGTGFAMLVGILLGNVKKPQFNYKSIIIFAVVFAVFAVYKKVRKKEISPILLIVISAVMGGIMF